MAKLAQLLLFACAFALAAPLPPCAYGDVRTPLSDLDDWPYTLLDTTYRLPESYAPNDLVSAELAGFAGGFLVRELVIDDLRALREAAEADGLALELTSAYRSYGYQERTFAYWVAREGLEAALRSSARAGHSEHQLGTALDFRSAGGPDPWDVSDWGETPEGRWLAENAHRFGFVMSYPAGQEELTCYIYEPWHYRYVGREVARAVTESGLTLREWLWRRGSGER
ncbi:M15 family metallopeptidase [Truepera radiovictrix]|uniref:M15 family metallopeptidase n=1 Tax=Truepera radiovictrix TaxID=332249 RepID=UPI00160E0D0B|nr:M15 family metallopeptidase [Truepera radiovictrix]